MADKTPIATLPIEELGHIAGTLASADPNEPIGRVIPRLAAGPPRIAPANLAASPSPVPASPLLAGPPRAFNAPIESMEGPPERPPGLFGRIGHGLETAGKDLAIGLGTEFAPRVMPWIPGTPQQARRLQMEQREGQEVAAKTAQESAQAGLESAEAAKTRELTPAQYALMGAQTGAEQAHGGFEESQTGLTNARTNLLNFQMDLLKNGIGHGTADVFNVPPVPDNGKITADMLNDLQGRISKASELASAAPQLYGNGLRALENAYRQYSTLFREQNPLRVGSLPGSNIPLNPPIGGTADEWSDWYNRTYIPEQARLSGAKAGATQAQELLPVIDPQTNRVIGYAPKGAIAGMTGAGEKGVAQAAAGGLTPAPEATVKGQAQMANTLEGMIHENIFPAIDDAKGQTGIWSGRVENFRLKKIGDPDSPAAKLQATLDAVPMMLGRMYGYRSAEYAREIGNFMNLRMDPDSLRAYLTGVIEHARTVAQQGGMGPKGKQPQAAPGDSGAQKPWERYKK